MVLTFLRSPSRSSKYLLAIGLVQELLHGTMTLFHIGFDDLPSNVGGGARCRFGSKRIGVRSIAKKVLEERNIGRVKRLILD